MNYKNIKLWFTKYRFLILGMLAILFTVLATSAIYFNVTGIERNRIKEYSNITDRLVNMVGNYLQNGEYHNIISLMKLQIKTTDIKYIAYCKDGVIGDQSSDTDKIDMTIPVLDPKLDGSMRVLQRSSFIYFDKIIPYNLDSIRVLRVVYSLEGFDQRKSNILSAIAIIFFLLILTTVLLYFMNNYYNQLVMQNTSLSKIQKSLEEEEQTKTRMIRAIAHDALHYVTVIKVMVDNQLLKLRKGKELTNIADHFTEVLESNDSLIKLLEDLKYNEYLKKGIVLNQPEQLDWQDFVNTVAGTMRGLFAKKGITLSIKTLNTNIIVEVDKDLIKRVMINLLHNAFKYTRLESEIKVWYEVSGRFIKTYVKDQGAGILKEHWDKILQPNVRLKDSSFVRPEDKRGTGLGLSNSLKFINLYGGKLGIHESRISIGTTLYFTLPLKIIETKEQV